MLCERCGKNEANVHITKNINGRVSEMNLCSECADASGERISFDGMMRDFFSSVMPARARRFDYRTHQMLDKYSGCEDCLEDSCPELKQTDSKEDMIAEKKLELKAAVMEERYEEAAKLRDEIKALEQS